MAFDTRNLRGRTDDRGLGATARLRTLIAAAVGVVAAVLAAGVLTWDVAALLGWDLAAAVDLAWMWLDLRHSDPARTARQAVREDPGRALTDALVLSACVASLLAVGLVVARAGNSAGPTQTLLALLAIASVAASWALVHATFTVRYARLYSTPPEGDVDFHQEAPPRYSDFAYLAVTVGMTFQVSDTDLTGAELRATVLQHALLSYLFGAVILATVINLVAGLAK